VAGTWAARPALEVVGRLFLERLSLHGSARGLTDVAGVCLCDAAGGVWGGAAAYVTVAVGFGMGVSYAALVRATAWTLAHNHLDP
jgi:hypothetical protein